MSKPKTRSHLAPDAGDLARLVAGTHHDPHSILGAHEYGDETVIRTLRPHAEAVAALVGGRQYPMAHVGSGVFAVSPTALSTGCRSRCGRRMPRASA